MHAHVRQCSNIPTVHILLSAIEVEETRPAERAVRCKREMKMTDVLLRHDFHVEWEDRLLYRGLRGLGMTGK